MEKILNRITSFSWLTLFTIATNFSFQVSAQNVTDLTIGTTYTASLSGNGDLRYYRIPIQKGKKIFVLLDKASRFRTFLSIKQGGLPDRGVYTDLTDQGVDLLGQAAGYCYVRVELVSYSSSDPLTGVFSITGHNESTFPKLALGQTLSNQNLKWNGDAKWYQVPVQAGKKINVLLHKVSRFRTFLSIKEGGLPDRGVYNDLNDQSVGLLGQAAGYCYVRVELVSYSSSDPLSGVFSISAQPAAPPAPTGEAAQSFYTGSSPTVANLVATGTGIKWYTAATGGTALASTTSLVNGTHYFASQTLNACESSSRLNVMATVISSPVPPMAGEITQTTVSVYPNPVSVSFALRINEASEGRIVVRIISPEGRKMSEFIAKDVNDEVLSAIPVNNLENGIYFVQVLLSNKDLYGIKIVVLK